MYWCREGINGQYYHHRRLFEKGEAHKVIHKTEEAVLFEVREGRFWVPKALLRGDLVHKNFVRSYLPTPEEMFK